MLNDLETRKIIKRANDPWYETSDDDDDSGDEEKESDEYG